MQNEEILIRSAQAGDATAFEQIYEEFFDKVYRYIAVRVGNPSDAEDLTEEVFLKALQSIGLLSMARDIYSCLAVPHSPQRGSRPLEEDI